MPKRYLKTSKQLGDIDSLQSTTSSTSLIGYAAVFNSLSYDLGGFREVIQPGAFKASLKSPNNIHALFQHDENLKLADRHSGTLRLRETAKGLFSDIKLRADKFSQSVARAVKMGLYDKMSFGFRTEKAHWFVKNGGLIRVLQIARLSEVSIVKNPAYEETSVEVFDELNERVISNAWRFNLAMRQQQLAELY